MRDLPMNARQRVFRDNGTLVIENIQRNADRGEYKCVAKDKNGFSASGKVKLEVMGRYKCFENTQMANVGTRFD